MFVFDDSIIEELPKTKENVKEILDYLTFLNIVGITTRDCWTNIEASSLPKNTIELLRGAFADVREISIGDTKNSIIKLCNYESKLKELCLISNKEYPKECFNGNLKSKTFLEVTGDIRKDKEFFIWKSVELYKIQKMKGSPTE